MEKKEKQKKILKISGLIGLFLLVFGLSYALFTVTLNGTKKVKVKTGKLELQLLDENDNDITKQQNAGYSINLENQVPISDEEGLQTQEFIFKLKNSGTISAKYTIYLDDIALEEGEERLLDQYVRYSLTKNGSSDEAKDLTNIGENPNRKLTSGVIKKDTTNTYTLKVWIDEDADNGAMDKVFSTILRVEGSQYISPFENAPIADDLYAKDSVGTLTAPIQNAFSKPNEEESGLYTYKDSEGTTTYVYRGLPEDNYVSFADQTWRILRIQEDGTIKLIRYEAVNYENSAYDYDSYTSNGVTYRRVQYNKTYLSEDDNKYSTSNIKSYVEAWYDATMTSYDSKIATNEYCSDRYEPEEPSPLKQSNYSPWTHLYGYINRGGKVENTYQWSPSVSCTTEKINTKAALITADEAVLAGSVGRYVSSETPYNNYLKKSYSYLTMSPAGFNGNATSYNVYNFGNINPYNVSSGYGVLPVITLKADVAISSGEGTSSNPYVIG